MNAQKTYHEANGRYEETFDELTSGARRFLLGDWSLPRDGYVFSLEGDGDTFTIHADPVELGETGTRYFFSDESGAIRYNYVEPASEDDPSV